MKTEKVVTDALMASIPKEYPEILADMVVHLSKALREQGLDVTSSNQVAWNVSEHIREHWGGQSIYIRQGVSYETRLMAEKVWSKFTGDNVAELAREFNVSDTYIYRLLRFMRADEVRRNQHQLFGDHEG